MDPIIGGALVNAGANIIGGIAANKDNKAQREWAEKQATLQYERSVEQWQRNNEYNTMAAQFSRAREAGANPWAMSGQAKSYESQPVQAPSASQGSQMSGVGNFIANAGSQISDAMLKKAQADNLAADTEKKKVENSILEDWGAKKEEAQVLLAKAQRDLSQVTADKLDAERHLLQVYGDREKTQALNLAFAQEMKLKSSSQVDASTILQIAQSIIQSQAQTDNIRMNTNVMSRTLPLVLENYAADTFQKLASGKLTNQTALFDAELQPGKLTQQQKDIDKTQSQTALNDANTVKAYVESVTGAISELRAIADIILKMNPSSKLARTIQTTFEFEKQSTTPIKTKEVVTEKSTDLVR